MKNQWVPNVTGHVRLKVKGKYPELFINRAVEQNIQVWNVRRMEDGVLLCSVRLDEVSKLRKIARASGCKFSFIDRRGFPFFLQSLRRRKGIIIGFVAFFSLLLILSNMVWGINIEGASPKVENELEKAIKEIGIKRGAIQFLLPPPQEIQHMITDKIEDATWIGVERKGTTYHFQVVEKEIAEREPLQAPGHIVASKKAIIHDYFIEEGLPMIKRNQLVNKGDILVSGLIGKEGEEQQVAAKGQILGEMWYRTKIEIPLERTLYTATGEKKRKYQLKLGGWTIPIYGFKNPDFHTWKEEKKRTTWTIFGRELPIQFAYVDILETNEVHQELVKKEAISLAVDKGKERLLSQFTDKGEIVGEKVLHHEEVDGKVIVIIHYRIVDEIGIKQPIVQGD